MEFHGKKVEPLTAMDVVVVEIIEHDSKRYGSFLYHLVSALAAAEADKLDTLRIGFPEIVHSFDRWKSGESGHLYDLSELAKSHLRVVK
jgi:hypothetical protein